MDRPIWEKLKELGEAVPEEEWRKLMQSAADKDRKIDSLELELAAEKHCHLKDNEYLLARIARLREVLKMIADSNSVSIEILRGNAKRALGQDQ